MSNNVMFHCCGCGMDSENPDICQHCGGEMVTATTITISPIANEVTPLPARLDSPYTLTEIMHNLEIMSNIDDDLEWCQRFAASVIERGIDAIPTTPGETPYFAKLIRENAAMLKALRDIRDDPYTTCCCAEKVKTAIKQTEQTEPQNL